MNFYDFTRIGADGFHQENPAGDYLVLFRTPAFHSADGYRIEYVEFRTHAELNNGIRFVTLRIDPETCFPVDRWSPGMGWKSSRSRPPTACRRVRRYSITGWS